MTTKRRSRGKPIKGVSHFKSSEALKKGKTIPRGKLSGKVGGRGTRRSRALRPSR